LPATLGRDKTLTSGLEKLRQSYARLLQKKNDPRIEYLLHRHRWLHIHQALRYIELLGRDGAEGFLETAEHSIMRTIRTNTLKISTTELMERLRAKGFKLHQHPYIDYGIVVEKAPYSLGATEEYLLGYYTIQGPASMLAVPAMEPIGNALVVDMCAGAGVKTTQIAQHSPRARITAFDINRRKLAALKNNSSRLGVANITAYHADATRSPEILGEEVAANILLDAPCSGEGLIPYEKGRWPRSFNDIINRMILQYSLLDAAVKLLKPGGTLVYSTCTISVEENEYLLSLILSKYPDLHPEPPPVKGGTEGVDEYLDLPIDPRLRIACRRYYPHIHRTEGFTICRLRMKTA
jgi:NOL1/NOP2/sun family putative RNA methylase